jgi:hypothetical protein
MPRIPTTPGIDTDIIKSFLPFAGEDKPAFHGKVINVTHYIQYSCVKKSGQQEEPTVLEKLKNIVPGTGTQTTKVSPDDAPISRLKKRRQTQITIGESTEWKLNQRGLEEGLGLCLYWLPWTVGDRGWREHCYRGSGG